MKKGVFTTMQRFKNFLYCLKQGLRGLWVNRVYSLASIGTMATCLLLLGLFYSVFTNFNYMISSAEDLIAVTVFFNEDTSEEEILSVKETILRERGDVLRVEYISAEEAWKRYKSENLNEEVAASFGEDNPLADSASLQVYLGNADNQDNLVEYLKRLDKVRKVNYSDALANSFVGIRTMIYVTSFVLIAILAAVAIFLIDTTVSTGVQVRRDEIAIMSLIGADEYFIRAPFMVEGVCIGLLGAAAPLIILNVIYGRVTSVMMAQFSPVFVKLQFVDRAEMMSRFIPMALVFAVGLGALVGSFTARDQIKKIDLH
ncbi:MAG: permease-like cell division protein FtsX [Lachnospiraceae bacterium]|nr:permease-like cell division protein FtsX [Lachnospiraceae bacterium]